MKLHPEFHGVNDLQEYINKHLTYYLEQVNSAVKYSPTKYKLCFWGFGISVITFIFLVLVSKLFITNIWEFLVFVLLLTLNGFFSGVLYLIIDSTSKKFDSVIYQIIFSLLNLDQVNLREGFILSKLNSSHQAGSSNVTILSAFDQSELASSITYPTVGTTFETKINNYPLTITEFRANRLSKGKHKDSGKNAGRSFTGYFCVLDLPKETMAKTFVFADKHKDYNLPGLSSDTKPITNILNSSQSTVNLEWNDFEDLLQVESTDQIAARMILTPDFMSELYDWWVDQKINIHISFIGNRMCVLFPDDRIQLLRRHKSISEKYTTSYLLNTSSSFYHLITLARRVLD